MLVKRLEVPQSFAPKAIEAQDLSELQQVPASSISAPDLAQSSSAISALSDPSFIKFGFAPRDPLAEEISQLRRELKEILAIHTRDIQLIHQNLGIVPSLHQTHNSLSQELQHLGVMDSRGSKSKSATPTPRRRAKAAAASSSKDFLRVFEEEVSQQLRHHISERPDQEGEVHDEPIQEPSSAAPLAVSVVPAAPTSRSQAQPAWGGSWRQASPAPQQDEMRLVDVDGVSDPRPQPAAEEVAVSPSPVPDCLPGTVLDSPDPGDQANPPSPRPVPPQRASSIEAGVLRPSPSKTFLRSGAVDEVRRLVEAEAVRRATEDMPPLSQIREQPSSQKSQAPKSAALRVFHETFRKVTDRAARLALHVGGVLPWSQSYQRVSMVYQWVIVLIHVAILLIFGVRTSQTLAELLGRTTPHSAVPRLSSDVIVPLANVAGLLAAGSLTGSKQLQDCLADMENYSKQHNFRNIVDGTNGWDVLVLLCAMVLFVTDRIFSYLGFAWSEGLELSPLDIVYMILFFVSAIQLLVLTLAVLRVTRFLAGMVDSFCYRFWAEMDGYRVAVGEWNVLQASVRMAGAATERLVAVLQAGFVLGILVLVLDLGVTKGQEWILTSSLVLLLMVFTILIRAAAVTEACTRVPQLINSTCLTDNPMDPDRKYLVEYITASAAGFYVFNVRLNNGAALRVFHYTCLIAVTLARFVAGTP